MNIDYIFDLPEQTGLEIEHAECELVDRGIQQAATYPLFRFPYTHFGNENSKIAMPSLPCSSEGGF